MFSDKYLLENRKEIIGTKLKFNLEAFQKRINIEENLNRLLTRQK